MTKRTPEQHNKDNILKDIVGITPANYNPEYSDTIKATALALVSQGYSYRQAADEVGVRSHNTIREWVARNVEDKGFLDDFGLHDLASQIKKRMSNRLYTQAHHVFEAMSEKDIESASLLQKVTAGSILIDKARLLAGESTENHAVVVKRKHAIDDKLIDLDRQIAELEDAGIPPE